MFEAYVLIMKYSKHKCSTESKILREENQQLKEREDKLMDIMSRLEKLEK